MTPSERLVHRLAALGYEVLGGAFGICYADGGMRRVTNVAKWGASVHKPGDPTRTIYSFTSTVTECARRGFVLGEAERNGDREAYANEKPEAPEEE